MKNGKCPKCNSSNVFKQEGGAGPEHGIYVYTSMLTSPSKCDSYICVDCGYFENYIMDTAKLQEVQKKWTRVA
jgi:predicted nucleic-acid-binding Zn-ribbon protein